MNEWGCCPLAVRSPEKDVQGPERDGRIKEETEAVLWVSKFHPFSSHGTHKLITKILRHTNKYIS